MLLPSAGRATPVPATATPTYLRSASTGCRFPSP